MGLKDILRPYASSSLIRWYHRLEAMTAAAMYGFPGRRLRVIGVTGTNGKTTTVHLIGAIMKAAGYKTATLSTVSFQIGEEREVNALNMTTPNPFILQRFLAKAVASGVHIAVIETTSHAILQERVWGIHYDIAVLTNLTHDHLDYHKTFEAYRDTKLRLFQNNPSVSVVNADDPSAAVFVRQQAYQHFTYGLKEKADVTARKCETDAHGSRFIAVTPTGQTAIELKLPGKFNIANALAAMAVGISQGIGLSTIKGALAAVTVVPGRMERIDVGQSFTVLIDYAHTPDAFEQIYETLKPVTRGRIIHVFGATGDRDKTKRPIMGALAARSADLVVLTTDEPYREDPEEIIDSVAEGVKRGRRDQRHGEDEWWWRIPDRKEAIGFALSQAKSRDVVLLTGMGDERFITVSDGAGGIKKIPWHERRVVKDLLLAQMRKKG